MTFTVAIVGRPNVGKSTLFNRLVGRGMAIVSPEPGVTRDWREGAGKIGPLRFRVIDTAGFEEAEDGSLSQRMTAKSEEAIAEADAVFFLIDGRDGVMPDDNRFADILRRVEPPVFLIVNKCEGKGGTLGLADAYSLGFGDPLPISAAHGEGFVELYDVLAPLVPDETTEDGGDPPLRLAVIGRPNVGKSTLVNKLIGKQRVITGPEPGLTRDSIAVRWDYRGREVRLVDTAGMRRRAKVTGALEKLSTQDSKRAIALAEVAVVVLDATEPPAKQDLGIAARALDEGRAIIIVLNKWDLVEERAGVRRAMADHVVHSLAQARGVPLIACSALTGEGIDKLMPAILKIHERWNKRVATAALNRWLADTVEAHPPPLAGGRRVKIRYVTQTKPRPPTFAAFVNRPKALPESYRRYLVNSLRDAFDFNGIPIRLMFRQGKNPYAKRD